MAGNSCESYLQVLLSGTMLGRFVDDVDNIITEKEMQRNQIKELVTAADTIIERFSGELMFLGVAPDTVSWPDARSPSAPQMILEVFSKLESSLLEFQEARSINLEKLQQAAVRVENNLEALKEHIAEAQLSQHVETSSRVSDIVEGSATVPPRDTEPSDPEPPLEVEDDESANLSNEESNVLDNGQSDEKTPVLPDSMPASEHSGDPQDSSTTPLASVGRQGKPNGLWPKDEVEESPEAEDGGDTQQRHGLEESQAVAGRFLTSKSHYDLETLMWTLIAEDDLAGAYWLAQFLCEEKYDFALSPTLIQALQASRWLSPESNQYVEDVLELVANYDETSLTPASEVLECAASIHASLIAPHSNIVGWLRVPKVCPGLKGVVSAVSDYVLTGNPPLRPEYITGAEESVRRQDKISRASLSAAKWLADAPKKFGNYAPATSVWKFLTGPGR